MTSGPLYSEKFSSNRTEALFLALTILFQALFAWRAHANRVDTLAIVFLVLFVVFLFYSLNYRTLVICLTSESLKLKFGVFTWTVSLNYIEDCRLDDLPALMKYGGAGIHFMMVRDRYRASFNFLEYPRVVIAFKRKAGPVQDISFSTRQPGEILQRLGQAITARRGTTPRLED